MLITATYFVKTGINLCTPSPAINSVSREKGVILPVALFMLVAATLLTLALVKANMVSLRVGGASVMAAQAQADSERGLNNFLINNTESATAPFEQRIDVPATFITTGAPSNTTVTVLARGCSKTAPRSRRPTQYGTASSPATIGFNLHQVVSTTNETAMGVHAETNAGISAMVASPDCPKP